MNVPAAATLAARREALARWGRPARIRVDHGHPWGSRGDLPTELGRWLLGLGIELVYNPPRQPQKNGVVERSQEVAPRWADPACCRDALAV
jgi:transposase InsO family protein